MKNNLKYYAAAAIVIAAAAVLFTSCAGSDLNSTVFVTSMGISLDKNIYSAALYGSCASKDGETSVSAFGTGRTPAEAMNSARLDCGKNLFLGHCERVAADSAALRNSAFLADFSDSVISPACKVYFSDSPEMAAENISDEGFVTENYQLAVCMKNGTPAVIPIAEDPSRIAVITAEETVIMDSEDSMGIMIMRDRSYPKVITAAVGEHFESIKISPKTVRKAYFSDGILNVDITVRLNAQGGSEEGRKAVVSLFGIICRSSFEKTVNTMGIDSINISALTDYTRQQLKTARLNLTVKY